MSNFLEKLDDAIDECHFNDGYCDNSQLVYECRDLVNSLGENAKRMLEIGIIQDELVKLGFRPHTLSTMLLFDGKNILHILVTFDMEKVHLNTISYSYTSPKWQEDLITKVKEIIK